MTFVIAEIGVNHNGSLEQAIRLVHESKKAGADAVKFQYFNSHRLWGDDRISQYELYPHQLAALKGLCDREEIEFMCTPFGAQEVEFLTPLVKRHKVGSGCRNHKILYAIRDAGLPVIASMGMASWDDVERLRKHLSGCDITYLQCTSSYPCQPKDVHLNAMVKLLVMTQAKVGFSDHTEGILAAPMAVAMGASVIEKHITLNRNSIGPDHKASIEPHDFKLMVDNIREVETMLGKPDMKILSCEKQLWGAWYDG